MTKADFTAIFGEHKDSVYRFAWRMTGSASAAEDVAQDCFLALLQASERYDAGRGPLRAFLIGVARNIIFNRWRAESRWNPLDDDAFLAEPVDPGRWDQLSAMAGIASAASGVMVAAASTTLAGKCSNPRWKMVLSAATISAS